jgi:hypothetical protein
MLVKEYLRKKPFYRLMNSGLYVNGERIQPVDTMVYREKRLFGRVMTQTDYVEEFTPSAHRIMNELFFPESYGYGEVIDENGEKYETMYREETFRVQVPLQDVITVQRLVHLCGNDIHFELNDSVVSEELQNRFLQFQKGWLEKNMDIAFYYLAKSVHITADGAIVYFMNRGKLGTRNLSFLNGDILFPHYDFSGEMDYFARKYKDYDENGIEVTEYVEVWDKTYMTRYKKSVYGLAGTYNRIKDILGLDGYEMVNEPMRHGFNRVPVVYMRSSDSNPCWGKVQPLIEQIEVALSYWAKACASTANDAYVMKGDDVSIKGDPLGRVRAFTMGKDDSVSLLEKNSSNEYFQNYVNRLFKECFRGSYIIEPPELKSGDTPAAAIKLLYSPNLEKAKLEAKEYKKAIDDMKTLFCEGYGIELGKVTKGVELSSHIFGWIIPYVTENTAELINNLVQSVGAGILSKQTASELTGYDTNAEWDRLLKEHKLEDSMDRLTQLRKQTE